MSALEALRDSLSETRPAPDLVDAIWSARRSELVGLAPELARLLHHSDPVVREEAVSVLGTAWRIRTYRPTVIGMLRQDADFGVRVRCVSALAAMSTKDTRSEDIDLLRQVVEDRTEDVGVVAAARQALEELRQSGA